MKTYTPEQEAKFVAVLREIQRSIPKGLVASALSEKQKTPMVEKVMNEAAETESIAPEKREKIKNLIATGMFSKLDTMEDPKRIKMVDDYVAREINKAIKAGRLPPRSHVKFLPSIMKIRNEN